jgi:hypothetical protein
MSRFRSESRFENPINPAPRAVAADKWFRHAANDVQLENSNHTSGSGILDNGNKLRGRPVNIRHGAFKRGFRQSGPEVMEGPHNS